MHLLVQPFGLSLVLVTSVFLMIVLPCQRWRKILQFEENLFRHKKRKERVGREGGFQKIFVGITHDCDH